MKRENIEWRLWNQFVNAPQPAYGDYNFKLRRTNMEDDSVPQLDVENEEAPQMIESLLGLGDYTSLNLDPQADSDYV